MYIFHVKAVEKSKYFGWSDTLLPLIARQLREAIIWPPDNLVRYFAPTDFKANLPTTRIIVDGTECPMKQPKASQVQQAAFSSYKNSKKNICWVNSRWTS